MFNRIRKIILLLALCMLAGCGAKEEPQQGPELVLGFSQLGTESAWRSGNIADIEKKA